MIAKRLHTIILVTQDCIARVDLSNGKPTRVVGSWYLDRAAHKNLAAAIEAALRLRTISRAHVYLLSDEIWAGTVSLSKEVVAAVSSDQLEQTLALEVEYDSGNSPFDSRLGYSRTDSIEDDPTWWVAQINAAQLQTIITAAASYKSKFIAAGWVSTSHSNQQCSRHMILDPTSSETCAEFAKEWLTRYLQNDHDLAAIRIAGRVNTAAQSQRVHLIVSAVALAFLVGLHQVKFHQLATAKGQQTQLVDHEQTLRSTLDKCEQFARQAQTAKLRDEAIARERIQLFEKQQQEQTEQDAARRRPVQVVRALSATADSAHWVRSIKFSRAEVTISGVAVSSNSVTRLAHRLEEELNRTHWIVQAANLSASESSLLVHFEITLVPISVTPSPAAIADGSINRVR